MGLQGEQPSTQQSETHRQEHEERNGELNGTTERQRRFKFGFLIRKSEGEAGYEEEHACLGEAADYSRNA
jgi:hypothetical protein